MSKWAALSGSNQAIWGAVAMVAVVAIGSGFYISNRAGQLPADLQSDVALSGEVDQSSEKVTDKKDDDTYRAAQTAAVTEDRDVSKVSEAAPELPETQSAPTIDEVRLESDGLAVIAGRAAPGSTISVLVDGEENMKVKADSRGSFAAVTVIATKADAQELTIVQGDGDNKIESLEQVILAPTKIVTVPAEDVATTLDTDLSEDKDIKDAASPEAASDQMDTPQIAGASDSAAVQQGETASADVTQTGGAMSEVPASDATADQSAQTVTEVAQDTETSTPSVDLAGQSGTEMASLQEDESTPVDPNSGEQRITILKSTPDGVEVLSNSQPQVLENISIDTISYSDTGDVQLAGRAQSEAKAVRVYVDNRRVIDLAVDPDGGWRGDLPAIDTGVYTLRVDQVDSSGDITSRVETPFKREDPQVLAEADDSAAAANQITVQTGNTLWAIARDRYGEGRLYVHVFEANKGSIRDPDLIYPGQIFALPNQ